MKTHTSEMAPSGAERREVKWHLTSPEPSEIAQITSETPQITSEMAPSRLLGRVEASEMAPHPPIPVFTTPGVHCTTKGCNIVASSSPALPLHVCPMCGYCAPSVLCMRGTDVGMPWLGRAPLWRLRGGDQEVWQGRVFGGGTPWAGGGGWLFACSAAATGRDGFGSTSQPPFTQLAS